MRLKENWDGGVVALWEKENLRDSYCVEGALTHHHVHTIILRGAGHILTSLVCRRHSPKVYIKLHYLDILK